MFNVVLLHSLRESKEWPGKTIYFNFDSIFGDFFLKFSYIRVIQNTKNVKSAAESWIRGVELSRVTPCKNVSVSYQMNLIDLQMFHHIIPTQAEGWFCVQVGL